MVVAVTGASGHIGANLVRALLKQGRKVRALVHHDRQALDDLETEIFQGDVCDPYSLYRAFVGVDVVYHLAANISISPAGWSELEKINVIGTRNIVEACVKCGVHRLVHFSSIDALMQEPLDIPVNEQRLLADGRDSSPYGRSKAAAEREVREGIEQGLDAIILNPTAVIGPEDYQLSYIGEALLAMAQGKLPALVGGGFNWVDVRDVVDGALRAEERAPIGAKYILSGHYATISDLAKLTEEILGTSPPRLVLPQWLARTGAPAVTALNQLTRNRPLYTSVSIKSLNNCNKNISHERATRELGFDPRPLRETLKDTFHWFLEAGLLDGAKIKKTQKAKVK